MQDRFRVRVFINKQQGRKGRLRISTQSKTKAVKLLNTLLNKYGWDECGYESYKINLSNSGGKQKSYKR